MKKKTVFLDRDGTINIEKNYLYKIEDFEFIERAPEAIALLKNAGYQIIVVTNQAGIARGYYTEKDVQLLHQYINKRLKQWNTGIDAFYYCPHHATEGLGEYRITCNCRKPKIGLFQQACEAFQVDRERSWMIGDNKGDIEAGDLFGLKTILVRTGYGKTVEQKGKCSYNYVTDNLYEASKIVVRMLDA